MPQYTTPQVKHRKDNNKQEKTSKTSKTTAKQAQNLKQQDRTQSGAFFRILNIKLLHIITQ
jgi:hypothetical protein